MHKVCEIACVAHFRRGRSCAVSFSVRGNKIMTVARQTKVIVAVAQRFRAPCRCMGSNFYFFPFIFIFTHVVPLKTLLLHESDPRYTARISPFCLFFSDRGAFSPKPSRVFANKLSACAAPLRFTTAVVRGGAERDGRGKNTKRKKKCEKY